MKKALTLVVAIILLSAQSSLLSGQESVRKIRKSDVPSEKTLSKQIREFDEYAEKSMHDWEMPGMAVVVVKDGRILLQKGYGVRELGKTDPVDTRTVFACASTTKAMTAVCMGILVDEGKVSWDDHVNEYLPEFMLYDPYITSELRIRDLFTHNSGIGNTDFLWSAMDISHKEIMYRMRLVKPSYSLRSGFVYQNVFYMVAGEVIGKISGQPWEEFLEQRVLRKLGMDRTFTNYRTIPDDNKATPHCRSNDSIKPVLPYQFNDTTKIFIQDLESNAGSAGCVRSSIEDMGKWILCMIDSSKYEHGRLLKPATWCELFRPMVIVPPAEFYPTMELTKPNWTTYSPGWFQHDYKGTKVNFHTGSLTGEIALNGQLPEYRLGIYVFGNLDHSELRHALMYKAFDLFALAGNRDWSSEFLGLYKGISEKEKAVVKAASLKVPGTEPSRPVADYAGKYADPLFGEVEVTASGDGLKIILNKIIVAHLSHWHYDTFKGSCDYQWFGKATAMFISNFDGDIEKLNLDGMEFKRLAGH